jgi:hypothetical protein
MCLRTQKKHERTQSGLPQAIFEPEISKIQIRSSSLHAPLLTKNGGRGEKKIGKEDAGIRKDARSMKERATPKKGFGFYLTAK